MILSGYQPQYFPRLHYLNRVLTSDIFEISDYIQFVKKHIYINSDGSKKRDKSHQAHTPIKIASGLHYLTLPLPDDLLPINKIKINYSFAWPQKHLSTLETAYSKALNFKKFIKEIDLLLTKKYQHLAELNTVTFLWQIIKFLTDDGVTLKDITLKNVNLLLKKHTRFRLQKIVTVSQTPIPPPKKGEANNWIIALCKHFNADTYYYGGTSHNAYMNDSLFKKSKIKTILQDWKCPQYHQLFPQPGFIKNLSGLDLIFNESLINRQKIIS